MAENADIAPHVHDVSCAFGNPTCPAFGEPAPDLPRWRDLRVYIEPRDWWVGYYRGDTHHYVCPLPTVVIRWSRRIPPVSTEEADRG